MNIKLNHQIIKELCGTVSFKRGDSFYRANKVKFIELRDDYCEALVETTEDFYVTIHKKKNSNSFHSKCSCPSLASFDRDCQHLAAVLISIYNYQIKGKKPIHYYEKLTDPNKKNVSEGLLNLFNKSAIRSSSEQKHFETRQIIDVEFLYKVVTLVDDNHTVGIGLKVGQSTVNNVREFLLNIKDGKKSVLSPLFTFDPVTHCFQRESDLVIQLLIQVLHDEKIYISSIHDAIDTYEETLLIPPSIWSQLNSLVSNGTNAKLKVDEKVYNSIEISNESLPLIFNFSESEIYDFQLDVKGLNQLILLNSYMNVFVNGLLFELNRDDYKHLYDLIQLLNESNTNSIPISSNQIDFFMENVIPGLKNLGEVHISKNIMKRLSKTELVAKLYLDRVKNKLLAGIDFHYDHLVINPLENSEAFLSSNLIRDEEKEYEILKLMDESSFTKTEGGYFIHNEELEYEFLHHMVPKLEKLVQIYATTAVRNRIFKENMKPQIRVKVRKDRMNWLEFKFELDGIPESEIREIVKAIKEKRKYYRLKNGNLFSLETREMEEIKRFLSAEPVQEYDYEGQLNLPIISGLHLLDANDHNNIFKFEESFRKFLDQIQNPKAIEIEVPLSLRSKLREYQKHGFKWMKTLANYGFGGILADEMGLGKTVQSIAFILSVLPKIRKNKLPVLIICPSSLTYNWLSEVFKFGSELNAIVIDGNKNERQKLQKDLNGVDLIITSYHLLRQDIKWYEKQAFHTVFFDEAQAFKNPLTQTARAAKKIQANHRFGLTGTPVENSLEELWSIYHVVFPELFQGLKHFSHLSRKKIARRIRPFLLRRLKEDVLLELPEKIEFMESVELLPEQKKLYAAYLAKLRHDTLKHLANDKFTFGKNRIRILAGLTRLRQICCHPSLFIEGYKGSSAKFEQLFKILEESKLSNRRVLIFSQFTKMLDLIGRELNKRDEPYFYLDGQTASEERLEICNRFNEGECDLFLISLKAGGVGLNLTGADTVILYDLWWNPAVEKQAADRAHRFGQTNIVQVIKLVASGTIEEKMNELQEKKRQLIEEIIDTDEKMATSLTEEDIREILML